MNGNMKIRNIVVCLIIPIIITNNNSYTMDNNDDYNPCADIFNEIKTDREIS